MDLFSYYLHNKIDELRQQGVKLKIIGRIDNLSRELQHKIAQAMELTKDSSKLTLAVAFGYGGRSEIIDACQKIIDSGTRQVNEEIFKGNLYDPDMPNVDIMIRTGKAHRISNFLLWQAAYAELFFLDKYWPDFDVGELKECLENFWSRERRFGKR
jgi:undecaprenyl diphosphate synthase